MSYTFTSEVDGARFLSIKSTNGSKVVNISSVSVSYECYNGGIPGEKEVSSLSLSNVKTTYDKGDSFVKPNVTAHYTDGSSSDVTNSAVFSGFDSSVAGNQTINVSYKENGLTTTTSFDVSVVRLVYGTYMWSSRTKNEVDHQLDWDEPNHYMTITFDDDRCTWFSTQGGYRCYIFFDFTAVRSGSDVNISVLTQSDNRYDFYQPNASTPTADGSAYYSWFGDGNFDRATSVGLTATGGAGNTMIVSDGGTTLTVSMYKYANKTYVFQDTFTFTLVE